MKASLKALAARFRPAKNNPAPAVTQAPAAPAPVTELDEEEGYSSLAAETIINKLIDQLDATRGQVRALAEVNRTLVAQMTKANATIAQLAKLPKNRYYGVRKG